MALCTDILGFPGSTSGKELACHGRLKRPEFNPWVGKIPRRKKWQPTPIFLPGKFHGQRSLAGYSPWGHERVRHDLATKQHPARAPKVSSGEGRLEADIIGKGSYNIHFNGT